MDEKAELNPNVKLWLEKEGTPILGEGRAELLALIEEEGSLNKAAKNMGMSYRHAWGIIKKIEDRLGYEIVKSVKGGRKGGGTELTEKGRELVEKYRRTKETLTGMMSERFPGGEE